MERNFEQRNHGVGEEGHKYACATFGLCNTVIWCSASAECCTTMNNIVTLSGFLVRWTRLLNGAISHAKRWSQSMCNTSLPRQALGSIIQRHLLLVPVLTKSFTKLFSRRINKYRRSLEGTSAGKNTNPRGQEEESKAALAQTPPRNSRKAMRSRISPQRCCGGRLQPCF